MKAKELIIGDLVTMNDKYVEYEDHKNEVFKITAIGNVGGQKVAWLKGLSGCYALDGLEFKRRRKLIDADELKEGIIHKLLGVSGEKYLFEAEKAIYEYIDEVPTVDAIPVDWIHKYKKHMELYEREPIVNMIKCWRKENEQQKQDSEQDS